MKQPLFHLLRRSAKSVQTNCSAILQTCAVGETKSNTVMIGEMTVEKDLEVIMPSDLTWNKQVLNCNIKRKSLKVFITFPTSTNKKLK
ncbi:hypothetical protein BpHYR1_053844 [Brachionus plicatilis]|uniref:Uncharacterized protein n=1 Tax=Brachionus plicatilis TaxID=10195 RepID=A0A3M7PDT7_BRAPC|nr:hypothetical protein BpHYR1_053844 [Brachionus plicatilis]